MPQQAGHGRRRSDDHHVGFEHWLEPVGVGEGHLREVHCDGLPGTRPDVTQQGLQQIPPGQIQLAGDDDDRTRPTPTDLYRQACSAAERRGFRGGRRNGAEAVDRRGDRCHVPTLGSGPGRAAGVGPDDCRAGSLPGPGSGRRDQPVPSDVAGQSSRRAPVTATMSGSWSAGSTGS